LVQVALTHPRARRRQTVGWTVGSKLQTPRLELIPPAPPRLSFDRNMTRVIGTILGCMTKWINPSIREGCNSTLPSARPLPPPRPRVGSPHLDQAETRLDNSVPRYRRVHVHPRSRLPEIVEASIRFAFSLGRLPRAGSNKAARIAMMAMTTSSSISVNAPRPQGVPESPPASRVSTGGCQIHIADRSISFTGSSRGKNYPNPRWVGNSAITIDVRLRVAAASRRVPGGVAGSEAAENLD